MAITNGELDFGLWEQIFYDEFDGGRKKRVLVKSSVIKCAANDPFSKLASDPAGLATAGPDPLELPR